MAKKEFDISNTEELRYLRAKWQRKDEKGRTIKPYFFGHVDKTKGYYDDNRKNYVKHDTSMDYLRQIIEKHREPRFSGEATPLTSILKPNTFSHNQENRKQIQQIMYTIGKFKKVTYFIWNGYAEEDERYQLHIIEEDKVIDEINKRTINPATMYRLTVRLDKKGMSDMLIKVLFNINNQSAFELIQESQESIALLEESEDGDIELFSKKYKQVS